MTSEKRFTIRFPLDLLANLKRYAQEDKRSINSEIVWILQEFSTRREKGKDAQGIQISDVSKHDH